MTLYKSQDLQFEDAFQTLQNTSIECLYSEFNEWICKVKSLIYIILYAELEEPLDSIRFKLDDRIPSQRTHCPFILKLMT